MRIPGRSFLSAGILAQNRLNRILGVLRGHTKRNIARRGPFPSCNLDDVVQNAYILLLTDEPAEKRPMLRLAANRACSAARGTDEKRRQRGGPREKMVAEPPEHSAHSVAEAEVEMKDFRNYFWGRIFGKASMLTATEKQVIRLHDLNGYSFRRIETESGSSFQKVHANHQRAVGALRAALGDLAEEYLELSDELENRKIEQSRRAGRLLLLRTQNKEN
jgi:DNA-directed RNA polymerase specialized sigma24 family protein